MSNSQRFFYQQVNQTIGEASYLPFLPITLINNNQTLLASGLLDTGATVNVLPYHFGENLGLDWDSQKISINLTGNLANYEAKAVLLKGQINNFPSVKLAFAWTKADNISIILGQVNFFLEFDICFYRSQLFFDVKKN
ncbi:aspartyl protease family protein [Geminocystis herdmanii]|uniref:aspartyl protease family protein n=1 Tax=Geminocystis herdmanii TaxID=669359 RepID=UPI00034883F9|nr:aspartyl protease family protein [Geminocystis herdmanii]